MLRRVKFKSQGCLYLGRHVYSAKYGIRDAVGFSICSWCHSAHSLYGKWHQTTSSQPINALIHNTENRWALGPLWAWKYSHQFLWRHSGGIYQNYHEIDGQAKSQTRTDILHYFAMVTDSVTHKFNILATSCHQLMHIIEGFQVVEGWIHQYLKGVFTKHNETC